MPHVLKARDGRNHTVSDERDLFQLVAEYMGSDFRDWLEEWADDYKSELQDELDELKNHQRQVFTNVYEEAERLIELTENDHPDMTEIHSLAEKIWDVIANEL